MLWGANDKKFEIPTVVVFCSLVTDESGYGHCNYRGMWFGLFVGNGVDNNPVQITLVFEATVTVLAPGEVVKHDMMELSASCCCYWGRLPCSVPFCLDATDSVLGSGAFC